MISYKENYLRAVNFERPEYIPVLFHINPACWDSYPKDALLELIENRKEELDWF